MAFPRRRSNGIIGLVDPRCVPVGRIASRRGGYEVDIEWDAGRLTKAVIRGISNTRPTCRIRYGPTVKELPLAKGRQLVLDGSLQPGPRGYPN